jgi:hypothetical protein
MARKSKSDGRRGERFNDFEEKPYSVGYGRPPEETRFKPNQSGNPKGRPRRVPTLHAVVAKVMEEKIEIREGERVLRMSNRYALVRNAMRRALNGDPKLFRALTDMMRIETGDEQGEVDANKTISAADEAILADFFARYGVEDGRCDDRVEEQMDEQSTSPDAPNRGRGRP